jgi:hypothetical protein
VLFLQLYRVAVLFCGVTAVALNMLAAVLFGALVGLDRRLSGRQRALTFAIAAALAGLAFGRFWASFAPADWYVDSIWVEISAACCVFALGFGVDDRAPWEDLESAGGALDEDDSRDLYRLRLFQAAAFGFANSVNAWAYALAFLVFMAAGHLLEWALSRALKLDGDEKVLPSRRDQQEIAGASAAATAEWIEDAPRSFIAALNAAYRDELAPRPGSSSQAPRQIRVVHNSAKPLDARSAANTRSIAPASGKAARHKSPTEARDPARGRR